MYNINNIIFFGPFSKANNSTIVPQFNKTLLDITSYKLNFS